MAMGEVTHSGTTQGAVAEPLAEPTLSVVTPSSTVTVFIPRASVSPPGR